MRIVKIPRETGKYQDVEENKFDLIEVPDASALATLQEIITEYADIADYISQNSITFIGEVL